MDKDLRTLRDELDAARIATLAEKGSGGDHFYGAWKGGSAKSGGGPSGGADGNPRTSAKEEAANAARPKAPHDDKAFVWDGHRAPSEYPTKAEAAAKGPLPDSMRVGPGGRDGLYPNEARSMARNGVEVDRATGRVVQATGPTPPANAASLRANKAEAEKKQFPPPTKATARPLPEIDTRDGGWLTKAQADTAVLGGNNIPWRPGLKPQENPDGSRGYVKGGVPIRRLDESMGWASLPYGKRVAAVEQGMKSNPTETRVVVGRADGSMVTGRIVKVTNGSTELLTKGGHVVIHHGDVKWYQAQD